MRSLMTLLVAILLLLSLAIGASAGGTMNGTGTVTSVSRDSIKINGVTYSLHQNVHVGIYERTGQKVIEVTKSLSSISPGQEVRFKTYGNMVLELIILQR